MNRIGMKKIALFSIIALLTSCSDFLEEDPRGAIVGTHAINNVEGLEAALTGTYKGLLRTWTRGFLTSAMQGFTMGGDDLTTLSGGNKEWFRQQDQFNVTSGNTHTLQIWRGCYKTIQGANNILNNYQQIIGDPAVVNQIAGEAHFLRALSYYWLVRGFGEIPLITESEFNAEMLSIGKSSVTTIYELIESDLVQAEELLGNTKRDPGRPNKGAAKALLADVYLTQGGWPVKDASKYALAAQKAKEVIDNKDTYGFGLAALEDLWSGTTDGIGTVEEVMSFHTSKNYAGSANAYYGWAGTPGEEGGWDDFFAEINFFHDFPEGKRKDITFHTEFTRNSDGSIIPWQLSAAKHPYYGKLRTNPNNHFLSSMPVHVIRYAHVLLVYAEAQARAEGNPNPAAYAALNAVRERAELPPLGGLSGEDFIQAVVDERAWEFAAEFTRWFDLVRLELVEEANANKHPDDLKPVGAITKDDYTFPIPAVDADINPNL